MKKVLKDKKENATKIALQAEHFRSTNENLLSAFENEWYNKLDDIKRDIKKDYLLEPN